MRRWSKVHWYVGITIVLVVVIAGCCFLGIVDRVLGGHHAIGGSSYGPRLFNWTPWALVSGLVGRLFGLVAVIVVITVVVVILWVTGRISISWRGPENRP